MVKIDRHLRHYQLICPTCGWFAGFGWYPEPQGRTRPNGDRGRVCTTCGTELLFEGLEPYKMNLIWKLKREDPHSSGRCGNGWCGFTCKAALNIVRDQNDITWWIKNK